MVSTTPFTPPLAEMLQNVTSDALMLVFAMLRAVPVVVVIVCTAPMTATVPPAVASRPVPLVVTMRSPPPLMVTVPPVTLTPVPEVVFTSRPVPSTSNVDALITIPAEVEDVSELGPPPPVVIVPAFRRNKPKPPPTERTT